MFVPSYPDHVGRLRPAKDIALVEGLYARMLANAVDLEADDIHSLCEAVHEHRVTVVCGITERDAEFSRSTMYNAVVVIGPDGSVLNRHRKLMPTNSERMVWGLGDATGLKVIDTPAGRIGALICFENYMPLARYALSAQGVDLYVAPTISAGDRWLASARHIALEGKCWVLGCGYALQARDIADVPGRGALYSDPDEWVNPGWSVIVDPDGEVVVGPLFNEYGILYADCDPVRARRRLDVAGHYSRPDVFNFEVHREPRAPVTFVDAPEDASTVKPASSVVTGGSRFKEELR